MKVSVAMATCEGERFLVEQLESIAAQSRAPDELVVFDDASTDATLELLRTFAQAADFEVRVEQNTERLGITGNFERAVAACSGDVILLADQDDVWLPQKVETLTGVLAREPETGLVFSDGEVVDANLAPLGATLWQSLHFDRHEQRQVRAGRAAFVFLRHVVAAGTTLAFRSDLRRHALPFPALRSCHDAFIAFVAAARAPVALVEAPLVRYRVHGANQIGIRRLGFFDQIAKARDQIETDAFAYAESFFEAARERLPDAAPDLREATDDKIGHARLRRALPDRFSERLPVVLREALTGRYGRFAYGWKSVAQDLWLR